MRRSAEARKGCWAKGSPGGEVGEWSEGGEGVADAQEEVAVAEAPEVLGVVVEVPGGAGEDLAGGEFEEDGVDDAVLIVGGLVGQAGDEAVDDEGDEKMLVVDVVQREHGAAVEQELGGEGLEAEVFEGDAERAAPGRGRRREGVRRRRRAGQCQRGGGGAVSGWGVGTGMALGAYPYTIDSA